ncbi:MAG: RNA 2',3'-cyclic phosphodiesterase [Alcanivoracaceae bacterium]|jgi:2'-5' RNA ligase|nr:RNA 2',3'-cyclic phosphodiesterase [Alcanivoracaceae bacterium]
MRVFIGLSVPDHLSLELISVRDRIVAQMASASPRPVIAANFHMTLLFLGEINQARKEGICAAVDQLVTDLGPISLRLDQARCFPDAGGRIFAAEAVPAAALTNLHQRLLKAAAASQAKPFRPHITLARLSRAFIPSPAMPLNLPFPATELCLYESLLSKWGVRYRALRRWPLPAAH